MELKPVNRRSIVHCPPGPWSTVLAFLVARFPKQGEAVWHSRLARGDVCTERGESLTIDSAYVPNRLLTYLRDVPNEPDFGLRAEVIYETDLLVIADKPHFMPVTPGGEVLEGSLLRQLQRQTGCPDLQPLHRIDAETAGLVAFCKRPSDRAAYQALFREKRVSKRYLGVSVLTDTTAAQSFERHSRIEADPSHFMLMREVEGVPNAHTRAQLLGALAGRALWALEPVTGKRHQLRVHLYAAGFPLLHDRIYPSLLPARDRSDPLPPPLQLLAAELSFRDPITATELHFSSRLRLLHSGEVFFSGQRA